MIDEFVVGTGLDDIGECPYFQSLNDGLIVMCGGHEDSGYPNVALHQNFEKLESSHVRHSVIDENQVDAVAMRRKQLQSILGVIEYLNAMIQLLQLQG